jgi:hypothetical protein
MHSLGQRGCTTYKGRDQGRGETQNISTCTAVCVCVCQLMEREADRMCGWEDIWVGGCLGGRMCGWEDVCVLGSLKGQ